MKTVRLMIAALAALTVAGCNEKAPDAPPPAAGKSLEYFRAHLDEAKTFSAECRSKGDTLQGVELANCKNASFALMAPTESVKKNRKYSPSLGGSN